jgi:hypothetical protein
MEVIWLQQQIQTRHETDAGGTVIGQCLRYLFCSAVINSFDEEIVAGQEVRSEIF